MSDRTTRLAGIYTPLAAVAATLLSPLLALAYFDTAEGAQELEAAASRHGRNRRATSSRAGHVGIARACLRDVRPALRPALSAIFLCARAIRARRPVTVGRLERWGWRVALFGYGLLSIGLLAAGAALIDSSAAVEGSTAYSVLDAVFIALMLPGMAISVIGSTILGIALLRARFQPWATAAFLTAAFPALFLLSTLLGHNGLALLPLFFAWGIAGLALRRESSARIAPRGAIAEPSAETTG